MQRHHERVSAIGRCVRRRATAAREQSGLEPLSRDEVLDAIAADYVQMLGQHGELEHDVGGTTPQQRAAEYRNVGENLHREHAPMFDPDTTALRTVRAWLNSEGHRENLMRQTVSRDGLGVYISGDMVYVCHLLAAAPTIGDKISSKVGSLLG